MSKQMIVFCTVPDISTAEHIADRVVGEGIAACLSMIPGVTSVYRWKGSICRDSELICVIKTTESRFSELEAAIKEMHPYEVPEIVAIPIALGHAPYLSWINEETVKKNTN
jgi:periplasmic divalent cation tolerance protein